jgi:hypothetical protein
MRESRTGPSDNVILGDGPAGDWGEAHGNYDELRFFTGLRPLE